jgi:hypothetical protein
MDKGNSHRARQLRANDQGMGPAPRLGLALTRDPA